MINPSYYSYRHYINRFLRLTEQKATSFSRGMNAQLIVILIIQKKDMKNYIIIY